jgi:hypothetical protein
MVLQGGTLRRSVTRFSVATSFIARKGAQRVLCSAHRLSIAVLLGCEVSAKHVRLRGTGRHSLASQSLSCNPTVAIGDRSRAFRPRVRTPCSKDSRRFSSRREIKSERTDGMLCLTCVLFTSNATLRRSSYLS